MDQPGLIPPDAEAAFDEVLARIEALRSETAGRIATLGTSLGLDAPRTPVARSAPVAAVAPPAPVATPVATPAPVAPIATPVHAPAPTPPVPMAPVAEPRPPVARTPAETVIRTPTRPTPTRTPTAPAPPRAERRESLRRLGVAARHAGVATGRNVSEIRSATSTILSALRRTADTVVAALRRTAGTMLAALRRTAGTMLAALRRAAGTMLAALRRAAGTMLAGIRSAASTWVAAVRRVAARAIPTLTERTAEVGRGAASTAGHLVTSATAAVRRALATIAAARATSRSAAAAGSRTVRALAARGSRWGRALHFGLRNDALSLLGALSRRAAALRPTAARALRSTAGALRSATGAVRALADRIPARAIPVSLVVLVVAAGGSLALRAADTDRGEAATATPDTSTPVAPILPPASPLPGSTPEPAPEPEPIPPARRPPSLVRIPAIGVDAATVPVGLEADGSMEIPSDVSTIGWYEPGEGVGVAPGQTGTAVLAGHVDSRTQGAGAFYHLRDLAVGDVIEVEHADGTLSRWRVTSVTQYAKDALPIDEVFVWDGPPRLALITCGGAFDWTARSYTDNIVVTAVPADADDRPGQDGPAVTEPRGVA